MPNCPDNLKAIFQTRVQLYHTAIYGDDPENEHIILNK